MKSGKKVQSKAPPATGAKTKAGEPTLSQTSFSSMSKMISANVEPEAEDLSGIPTVMKYAIL
eukprot:gene57669-76971_t